LRLTVVIPNRNHATRLPRSLGAMLRQQRQADEIIVVDDASTDNSRDVIRGFMSLIPQLRLLENPNQLGAIGALNRGLHAATGDAVYCGAADDATDPEFIEVVLGALERNPAAGLACAEARVLSENGGFLGLRPASMPVFREGYVSPTDTAAMLRRMDNCILSVVTILRRDKMLSAGGFDEALGPFCDSFLERRIALQSGFVFIPQVLGTWFVQPESYSRNVALNVDKLSSLIAICRDRVKASEGAPFPHGYGEIFVRRARFSSARLAVMAPKFDPRLINAITQGGALAGGILELLALLPDKLRRVVTLAWLTIRLRPTSLVRLVESAARRWLRGSGAKLMPENTQDYAKR